MNRVAVAIGLIAACVAIGACTTTHPGVRNHAGTLKALVTASPDRVIEAAERAAGDLKLSIESSAATRLDGEIIARTAQGRKVTIRSTTSGDDISEVSVRVGDWGDAQMSMVILDAIRASLAELDSAAE